MKLRFPSLHLILILSLCASLQAQEKTSEELIIEAKDLLREAVTSSDRASFLAAKNLLEPLTKVDRLAPLARYYLGYADYQLGVVIERMDKDRAVVYLDSAIMHLEIATTQDERFAEAYALLASCYGIKISFAPLKGITLGLKSGSLINKAKSLTPENPRVAFLDAIGTYNTPALFGGGKEKGLNRMKEAAVLFDRWVDRDSLQPSWGHEEVYSWIGRAHLERKEPMLAKKAFEKSLEINPRYGWVKNVLMPKLEKSVQTQ